MTTMPVQQQALDAWRVQLLADTWRLDDTDLARLWDVPADHVRMWRTEGAPAACADTLAPLLEACEHLSSRLRVANIPAAVRRPLASLGQRSILDLARDDPARARQAVISMFP